MNKKNRNFLIIGLVLLLVVLYSGKFFSIAGDCLDVGATWNNPSYDGNDLKFQIGANIPRGWTCVVIKSPSDSISSISMTQSQCSELGWRWDATTGLSGVCEFVSGSLSSYDWNNTVKCDYDMSMGANPTNWKPAEYGYSPIVTTDFNNYVITDREYARCLGDVIVHVKPFVPITDNPLVVSNVPDTDNSILDNTSLNPSIMPSNPSKTDNYLIVGVLIIIVFSTGFYFFKKYRR